MVLTRSKMADTFIRLPRFGRISINQKMEVEEVQIKKKEEVNCDPVSELEENTQSCFTLLNDSDNISVTSEDTVFSTPKKQPRPEKINFSPLRAEEKVEINDYEQRREARMRENLKVLQDLGIKDIIAVQNKATIEKTIVNKKKQAKLKRKRMIRARLSSNKPVVRRKSPRLTKNHKNTAEIGQTELDFDIDAIASMMKKSINKSTLTSKYLSEDDESDSEEEDYEGLLEEEKKELAFVKSLEDRYYTCEEYFTLKGVKPKFIQQNGKFIGWVEEGLRKKIGIAADKETAWENNGGGKFTFKTPTGKLKTAESAKETARKMLFKNPNSYFYRHTAPGLDHWQGDWTEPENERFLEVAKMYGVGNKWGLFATYIGHRVGYQCSNHYRAHFVEGGIIWDGNFMLDKYGKSIYVGRKNKYV